MSVDEIPEALLNDPQFRYNLIITICNEIVKNEKIASEGLDALKRSKERLPSILAQREMLKKMIEVEKIKKSLLEPTYESSNRLVDERSTQLALVSAQLDEESLREKADIETFRNIVKMYKATLKTRLTEYEAMIPLAAERHKAKVKLQLLKIVKMVKIQKIEDMKRTQEQKRKIDERRLQVAIIELLTIVSRRAEMQKKLKAMDDENSELVKKLEGLKKQKEQLIKKKEEEEREKLRARQLMPPPKLDMSVFKTFCSSSSSEQQIPRQAEICDSSDGDNLSINTAVLEEMCRDEDQQMDVTEDDESYEMPSHQVLARSITMVCSNQSLEAQEINGNPENFEVLERCCSQLSLEEEDDDRTANDFPINSPIEVQAIVEPLKSRDSPARKPSSILKAQSILRKPKETLEKAEGPPEEKKAKIDEKKSQVKSVKDPSGNSREVAKIQSVEKNSIPRAVPLAKPLVAEVTPTLSNLFSPRHYAPSSCASSEDLDSAFDTNIEDAPGLPNEMNWGDFSPPPRDGSYSSFTSEISAFKPATGNDDPPTNAGDNFLSMFNKGSQGGFGHLFDK